MKTLTSTLRAALQAASIDALTKVELTYGASSYTYAIERIRDITFRENGSLQSAELDLNNSDGVLTNLDLKGYKAVLSVGAVTTEGDEYCAQPWMWVTAQRFDSSPGSLKCSLFVEGICNLMEEDKASDSYLPDDEDTKTVKTLINQVAGATLACFSHCTAYEVVWDSEDSLIDSYQPKDDFRIYLNGNRMSAINRLLQYTNCVIRAQADGKLHIFVPVTTGTSYDYEYSLETGHAFFSKASRNRLVMPNYIKVQSREDDDPSYSGTAQDSESYGRMPKREFHQKRLDSNDQAQDIAEAILAKAQMWAEAGAAEVPMNPGAEVYDYVKVTDARQSDFRVGNIGTLTHRYTAGKNMWRTTFTFGNWQSVRKALAGLGITSDDLEQHFNRLSVNHLYVENLLAKNMGFYWLDPDNTIDITKILGPDAEFSLDNLPDGEQYARVSTWNLSLDEDPGSPTYGLFILKLDEHTVYKPGYDPTEKRRNFASTPTTPYDVGDLWIDGSVTKTCINARASGSYVEGDWLAIPIDAIADGTTFKRVKSAALSADGLVLMDQVVAGTFGKIKTASLSAEGLVLLDQVVDGTYGKVLLTDIKAGHIHVYAETDFATGYNPITKEEQIHRGTSAPSDTTKLWLDTSTTPAIWKRWTGSAWQKATPSIATEIAESTYLKWAAESGADITADHASDIIYRGTSAPAHKAGRLWFDTNVSLMKRSTGSAWQLADPDKLDLFTADGEWYNYSGVSIDATKGICIYGTSGQRLITSATKWGTAQCYVGTDGRIYAGAGNVRLGSDGIRVSGGTNPAGYIDFYAGTTLQGWMCVSNAGVFYFTKTGGLMEIGAQGLNSLLYIWGAKISIRTGVLTSTTVSSGGVVTFARRSVGAACLGYWGKSSETGGDDHSPTDFHHRMDSTGQLYGRNNSGSSKTIRWWMSTSS